MKEGVLPPGVLGYEMRTVRTTDPFGKVRLTKVKVAILDLTVPPEGPQDPNLLTKEQLAVLKLKGQLMLPGIE